MVKVLSVKVVDNINNLRVRLRYFIAHFKTWITFIYNSNSFC